MFDNINNEIILESQQALKRIQIEKENNQKKSLTYIKENVKKINYGRNIFEEFDEEIYKNKSSIDMIYFNQLLDKLSDDQQLQVEVVLSDLYKTVYNIYEHINIAPEVFGIGVTTDILKESEENCNKIIKKSIHTFLENKFYRLTPYDRNEKYSSQGKEYAKILINEGVETEEAIKFSIKSIVMENLIKNICFPFSVWSRISNLMESEDYGLVFDQDKLINHVNKFETKSVNVARIISAII